MASVATHTASGTSDSAHADRLKRIGYRPFYRVGTYSGDQARQRPQSSRLSSDTLCCP